MTKKTSENAKELPNGWEWKRLGEIVDFQGGSQPPKSEFSHEHKEGYVRLIQIRDYKSDDYTIYVKQKSVRKFCNKTDVMIGRYGPPVFQILRGLEGAYNVALMKAIPKKELVNQDYLFRFLQNDTIQTYINGLSQRSAGQSGVDKNALEKYKVLLPPLKEQERIVQKLDTAFQSLDEAITLQKENIAHTQELKKAVLVEQITNLSCEMKKLGEVVIFNPSKSEVKDLDDCEVSFVPMADMNERKMYFETKQTKLLSEVYKGYTYFKENDILLAKVTPCFENGKSGIARDLINKIGFGSSEYFVFRAKQIVISQFIYYIISSNDFLEIGANNVSGAVGLKRVTKGFIENYKIPLPSLPEQEKIVAYLETSFAKLDTLIVEQQERLAQLTELKKSILQEAFEGKL